MHTLADLMRLFDFTADDLTANRAGILTERQRARIASERQTASIEKASALIALICFVGMTALFLFLAFPLGNALGPWTLVAIFVWFGLTAFLTNRVRKVSARWLRKSVPKRKDPILRRIGRLDNPGTEAMQTGAVSRFSGVLTHGDDGEHRSLMLDDEPFQSDSASGGDDERLWKLKPGIAYAIYAVPDALWVVSVEPLTDPQSPG